MSSLVDSLADLIPKTEDIRLVAVEAGLTVHYIPLTGSPVSNWTNVITEANRVGKWAKLISVILWRYPEYPALWDAIAERAPGQVHGVDADDDEVTVFGRGGDNRDRPLGERMASLEAKVQALMWGMFGLYIGLILLGILVMTRGN